MKTDVWAATQSLELGDEPPSSSPLLDAKIMMLDDEPLMTDLVQAHLEEEGYANFVICNDPRQAMAMLRREDPGLLLLDLMMPQVSGFEVLEAIRADRLLRYTPVIVLTAATGGDSKLRALQLGATDFLSKPVDASELVLRVRNTLAYHQYHKRLVNFDPVTGLPAQGLFERGLDEVLARRELVGGLVALFSITVPECRTLRERIGRASADALARVLARRLDQFAEAENGGSALATSSERAPLVARLGTEQFGVLLEGMPDASAIEAAAKQLMGLIAEPLSLGLHDIAVAAWIGVAMAPVDGLRAEALRKSADLACSHARSSGTVHIAFASPELNARSLEQLALGSQLRGAVQRGELLLHYQPKVDVASKRIVGAEALVRWQHPQHGLVSPGRFIPLAEELGLIGQIGQWVLETACRDAADWARLGHGDLKIAVNVAKPQFQSGDLCTAVRQALFDSGLPAQRLVLELTESMLMDDLRGSLDTMHALKALGLALSIDDFGTGYSSLSYLKRFPLDELKIDRSFIVDLPGSATDLAILRTVIDLGRNLGMSVTAEGIETAAQLQCIEKFGCNTFQGFLHSKPVPKDAFVAMLPRPD